MASTERARRVTFGEDAIERLAGHDRTATLAPMGSESESVPNHEGGRHVDGAIADPILELLRVSGEPVKLSREPISDDILRICLDAAAMGHHTEPRYEFVVVRDAYRKHQLARIYRQGWSVYRRIVARGGSSLEARQWEADHFEDVPVVVVGCAKGLRPILPAIGEARYYASVLPPMHNLMLAARSLGLSASMSTLAVWSGWQARRTLDLPVRMTPAAVVTLGWPRDGLVNAPQRRGTDFAVLDHHGTPFPVAPK